MTLPFGQTFHNISYHSPHIHFTCCLAFASLLNILFNTSLLCSVISFRKGSENNALIFFWNEFPFLFSKQKFNRIKLVCLQMFIYSLISSTRCFGVFDLWTNGIRRWTILRYNLPLLKWSFWLKFKTWKSSLLNFLPTKHFNEETSKLVIISTSLHVQNSKIAQFLSLKIIEVHKFMHHPIISRL